MFSKVNPIPAAAHPEYEFNIEITTGISAPPIGIISKTPTKNEITIIVKINLPLEFYISKIQEKLVQLLKLNLNNVVQKKLLEIQT